MNNERARQFLEAYAAGGEIDGGWLYAKALRQAQLDYSEASLDRLDQLIAAIKTRVKPSAETLQGTAQGRNLCTLLACYLMEIACRASGASCEWHDRASALQALPPGAQLPDTPFMRVVPHFPDQGLVFAPLAWIEGQILGTDGPGTARDNIAGIIGNIERNGPVAWGKGMEAMGRMASWQMMMLADGGQISPLRLSSTAPFIWVQMIPGPREDQQKALERGARILEQNPEGATWQVMSYDGYVELKAGRFDAVLVILHTYGKTPLQIKIAFPYRPAANGRRFAILDPQLREGNVEMEAIMKLNGALEQGIQSIKWAFGTTWDQLREVG